MMKPCVRIFFVLSNLLIAQSSHPVDMDSRYLMTTERLEKIRSQQDVHAIRKHAWELFLGINQNVQADFPFPLNRVPVWLTWNTKEEVFQGRTENFFERLHTLDQFLIFAQEEMITNRELKSLHSIDTSQIPLSTIFLNPPTANRLRTATPVPGLPGVFVKPIDPKSIETADAEFTRRGIEGAAREIAPFPDNSLAVKTAWYLVSSTVWRANQIPVWHGPPSVSASTDALKPNQWPDHVRIDPRHARYACPRVDTTCEGLEKPDIVEPSSAVAKLPIVPVDNLFYVPVCTCDQAKAINSKFGNLYGAFPGDFIVLMGLHLTTREIPDWVWATFWWSDRTLGNPFLKDRPLFYPSPWNHYLMDATLDMVTPQDAQKHPKAIYNPWLEVVTMPLDKAITSNCMNCHRTSVFPRVHFPAPGSIDPAGQLLRGKTKLDFLWTIGSQFDPPTNPKGVDSSRKP